MNEWKVKAQEIYSDKKNTKNKGNITNLSTKKKSKSTRHQYNN